MSLAYLSMLSIAAIIITLVVLLEDYLSGDLNKHEVVKYIFAGVMVALFDFFIEFLGVSAGGWTYYESWHHIMGKVPVELLIVFFCGGVIAKYIYYGAVKKCKRLDLDAMFYLIILIGLLEYFRSMYVEKTHVSMLIFAVPFGLWGIITIKKEVNKISALVTAFLIAVVDYVLETIMIGRDAYGYECGFGVEIPIIYALMVLGFLGILEKFDKIEQFLEHFLVRNVLKLFGVKRK